MTKRATPALRAVKALTFDVFGTVVDWRGSITREGRALGKALGVRATPTFDFYGTSGERLYRHVGGIFDPAEFLLLERYVASDAYRSQSFAQFKQQAKRT